MTLYQHLARYYDQMHAELRDDIPFLQALAAQAAGPILELGCGTGRVLIPLARDGHPITGLDSAEEMLDRLQVKLAREAPEVRERVRVATADMTGFCLPEQDYSLGLFTYNTFMHLDEQGMRAALESVRRHLRPRGQLLLDLANPFLVAQVLDNEMLTLEQVLEDLETGDSVRVLTRNHLDADAQILHVTWVYESVPPVETSTRRLAVDVAYHFIYPHEVELLLQQAGYSLHTLYGDYAGGPFGEESERMLVLAFRKSDAER